MMQLKSSIPGVNEMMEKFSYISDPIQRMLLQGQLKDYPFKESEKEVFGEIVDDVKLLENK